MDVVCGFVPSLVVTETLLLVAPSINRDAACLVSKLNHRGEDFCLLQGGALHRSIAANSSKRVQQVRNLVRGEILRQIACTVDAPTTISSYSRQVRVSVKMRRAYQSVKYTTFFFFPCGLLAPALLDLENGGLASDCEESFPADHEDEEEGAGVGLPCHETEIGDVGGCVSDPRSNVLGAHRSGCDGCEAEAPQAGSEPNGRESAGPLDTGEERGTACCSGS